MADHLQDVIDYLREASIVLAKAHVALQAWEGEREGRGREFITGALNVVVSGITDSADGLADHLQDLHDGEYKD